MRDDITCHRYISFIDTYIYVPFKWWEMTYTCHRYISFADKCHLSDERWHIHGIDSIYTYPFSDERWHIHVIDTYHLSNEGWHVHAIQAHGTP